MAGWLTATASAEAQVKYNFTGDFTGDSKSRKAQVNTRNGNRFAFFAPNPPAPRIRATTQLKASVPVYAGRATVHFSRSLKPGTILISTAERRLYYVLPDGKAVQYGIGVGREGFTWRGVKRVSRKEEWPSWNPPARMIEREKAKGIILPTHMAGGPNNPLGARAMYLGNSLFRIHGTNQPASIGQAVSSGCIRMLNEEVIELYDKVAVGTLVVVE
jgi:lipoprotein-anchoring transpeptidase ErfK/SrfK